METTTKTLEINTLTWIADEKTLKFIDINQHKWNFDYKYPAKQFDGEKFNNSSLMLEVDDLEWMKKFKRSLPINIIKSFQNDKILEGLALVVLWGGMSRTKQGIYTKDKLIIKETLFQARNTILETNKIDDAWNMLHNDLEWTNVMISKTLHFVSRASGFQQNPPVPIDGAVILKTVWPFLTVGIEKSEHPRDWANGLAGYRRYMTFVNYFALKLGWTTTQFENTLFQKFG